MHVYNSLSRQVEEFRPIKDKEVIMYICGLTPYDSAHIGHTRTYVSFDVIKRHFLTKGYSVFHIQNVTDVDDKIIRRCRETGEVPERLVERHHDEALEYFGRLNILRADVYPKVTEHIAEIIELIKKLVEKGYAYETETGVYYSVERFRGYGALSGQNLEEIRSGARIEIDETKRAAEDFALWKKTRDEIIEFSSPFGRGRPGWHIECSAMANKYAKRTGTLRTAGIHEHDEERRAVLDIHGGARDLVFPHHENEIAQSEPIHGKFCSYWLHTGFLTVSGEKMSKSLGNFITIKEVAARFSANAIRLFFIQTHYRSPIDYSEESLAAAGESVERIFNTLGLMKENVPGPKKPNPAFRKETNEKLDQFYRNMDNDFNTPDALASLFELLHEVNAHLSGKDLDCAHISSLINELEKMLWVFGLEEKAADIGKKTGQIIEVQKWIAETFKMNREEGQNAESMLEQIVEFRDSLREKKRYKEADGIRNRLKEIGIILEDKEKGKRWKLERY